MRECAYVCVCHLFYSEFAKKFYHERAVKYLQKTRGFGSQTKLNNQTTNFLWENS